MIQLPMAPFPKGGRGDFEAAVAIPINLFVPKGCAKLQIKSPIHLLSTEWG
jgi:hypothetical protein